MPEGPEVRRAADALHAALAGQPLTAVSARTRAARAWLEARPADHPEALPGRTVERVWSHGKVLVATLGPPPGGGARAFFASHFMMWGRWHVVAPDDEIATSRDRRERARVETPGAVAVLFSAPVFEVGTGDPYAHVAHLPTLGPDVLAVPFDAAEARRRLLLDPERTVGAALLDQTALAGVGNYLRAEVLWQIRLDPWTPVGDLSEAQWASLLEAVPGVCQHAYATGGRTVTEAEQARLFAEPGMTYNAPAEWSTRHAVFRRTNLPCLRCGDLVRQKRQTTRAADPDDPADAGKERVVYFCPTCQDTRVALPPVRPRRLVPAEAADRAAESAAADA